MFWEWQEGAFPAPEFQLWAPQGAVWGQPRVPGTVQALEIWRERTRAPIPLRGRAGSPPAAHDSEFGPFATEVGAPARAPQRTVLKNHLLL